jgi:hypothetical protein
MKANIITRLRSQGFYRKLAQPSINAWKMPRGQAELSMSA